ncbi:hypothetical protein GGI42DRAFT_288059 [Trichoderma sp. SZMC 28013]
MHGWLKKSLLGPQWARWLIRRSPASAFSSRSAEADKGDAADSVSPRYRRCWILSRDTSAGRPGGFGHPQYPYPPDTIGAYKSALLILSLLNLWFCLSRYHLYRPRHTTVALWHCCFGPICFWGCAAVKAKFLRCRSTSHSVLRTHLHASSAVNH